MNSAGEIGGYRQRHNEHMLSHELGKLSLYPSQKDVSKPKVVTVGTTLISFQEKARQRETEEGMRRTLLRGMSAMNMEAMRVITGAR